MQDHIYDDQYSGTRFTYGFTLRPLDINTHPKLGCILGSYRADDKRARYGVVDYARKLDEDERQKWELNLVGVSIYGLKDEIEAKFECTICGQWEELNAIIKKLS